MTGDYPVFLVLDLETTGLMAGRDRILEIGAIALNIDLGEIDRFHHVLHYDVPENWRGIHPTVAAMHKHSGLWDLCSKSKLSEPDVMEKFSEWLEFIIFQDPVEVPVYLTGNTIEFDKQFLIHARPDIVDYFHYRLVNISSFKIVHNAWCLGHEGLISPTSRKLHRSIPDCEDSIAELKYYREHFFYPGPRN